MSRYLSAPSSLVCLALAGIGAVLAVAVDGALCVARKLGVWS